MNALTKEKSKAREKAYDARMAAFDTGLDKRANDRLLKFLTTQHGHVIAGYMPIKTEISPLETMNVLFEEGKDVCVPIVRSKGQPLEFARWRPSDKMIKGDYGAMIPAEIELVTPDIVIVPLVAYDTKGNRLGYGGGFYDRTLQEVAYTRGVNAVGFAYSVQRVPRLPVEQTDYVLDYVVTEKEVLSF